MWTPDSLILQKPSVSCKDINWIVKLPMIFLTLHLNIVDYPKLKKLIDNIAATAEEFVSISQKEINQYSDFQIWQLKDTASELLKTEKEQPGSLPGADCA